MESKIEASPNQSVRRHKESYEWTSQEYVVVEKWSLEHFVMSRKALVCAIYYQRLYYLLAIPAAICAFLTAPGQMVQGTFPNTIGLSLLLGILSLAAGILSILTMLLHYSERAQEFTEQATFYKNIHLRIEKELDRVIHDVSFDTFADMIDFFDIQQNKNYTAFMSQRLLDKCKAVEKELLAEKIVANRNEFDTIYKARKYRRALNNEQKCATDSESNSKKENGVLDLTPVETVNDSGTRRRSSQQENVVIHVK